MTRRPGNQPLEEMLQQIDWKKATPLAIGLPLTILILIGLFTCFYTVQTDGVAVVKRFGKVIDINGPGLHFKLPFGIDRQEFVPTRRVLKEEFGFRTVAVRERTAYDVYENESLMLTGDLKVINVEWVVQYNINDPYRWLHRIKKREETIRDISEAVMRRIVGNSLGSDVLTEKRVQVAHMARDEMQKILDSFEMGVEIETVELQDVTPPGPVRPAFNEVNEAEQERERFINEAERERNRVLPQARGEAIQMLKEAEAYSEQRVNRALGEAARFSAILEQYLIVPDVTRQRLYLEMIDSVLPRIGRIYVVEDGQMQPIPLLNLGDGEHPFRAGGRGGER